jgi:hypothetical protein
VIFGHLLLLASQVLNIILSFLMIFRTTLGFFPLRLKSNTISTITHVFSFFSTQFGRKVKSIQCDNGRDFNNSSSRQFFLAHDMQLRMSCPYTSPQNGKSERMLCTTNNIIHTLLFQASMPPQYWVESLHTTTHLLNHLLINIITASCHYIALYNTTPT